MLYAAAAAERRIYIIYIYIYIYMCECVSVCVCAYSEETYLSLPCPLLQASRAPPLAPALPEEEKEDTAAGSAQGGS